MSFAASWVPFGQVGEGRKEGQSRRPDLSDESQIPVGAEPPLAACEQSFPRALGGFSGRPRSRSFPAIAATCGQGALLLHGFAGGLFFQPMLLLCSASGQRGSLALRRRCRETYKPRATLTRPRRGLDVLRASRGPRARLSPAAGTVLTAAHPPRIGRQP